MGASKGKGPARRRYRKAVWWKLDADYRDRLTPAERKWLDDFLDAHYNARFQGHAAAWPKTERRKADRARNAATRDLASQFDPVPGECVPPAADPELDLSPTPEYLNSPDYKAALAAYRATLSDTHERVPSRSVAEEREHRRAARRLEQVTEWVHGPEEEGEGGD